MARGGNGVGLVGDNVKHIMTYKALINNCKKLLILSGSLFLILIFSNGATLRAETIQEIQAKISAGSAEIKKLEKEIAGYQTQLNDLGSQATSLSATIKSLDITQKKLQANIQVTENKIANKNLEIQELGKQIQGKENNIVDNNRIVSYSLALVQQSDDTSIVEMLLSSDSISSGWDALYNLGTVQGNLIQKINELRQVKANLESNKIATEKAKAELVRLNNELKDQREIVLGTQAEKNKLLKETKQSEVTYKKILANKQAEKEAFEREVLNYESQLKLAVDLSKIPHSGSGVLAWPLDKITVTQYFGNTDFANANPQVYSGKGHNGVDFRAAIGTPVKAAMSGVVSGVGNTDLISGCYSYGKWVMVDHPNGLSTLYAHFSLPSVTKGQSVSTGQIIGYSGNTGYTTGPHLHFGVYATQGVQVAKLTRAQSTRCAGAVIPLADFKAYLNPLSYL